MPAGRRCSPPAGTEGRPRRGRVRPSRWHHGVRFRDDEQGRILTDMQFSEALGASYRLQERIGSGAVGEVWRATDLRTGETVAAKLLRPEHAHDSAVVERFVRERSLLTRLRHPNIVSVRDLVVEGDRLAIVMDHLDGGSPRDLLAAERTLPPSLAVFIAAAVLDGLAAAHAQQVLHRDVKPDNV